MTEAEIANIKDPLIRGSYAAMKRAALRAREIAKQTNTYIVIMENGKIVKIPMGDHSKEQAEEINATKY